MKKSEIINSIIIASIVIFCSLFNYILLNNKYNSIIEEHIKFDNRLDNIDTLLNIVIKYNESKLDNNI